MTYSLIIHELMPHEVLVLQLQKNAAEPALCDWKARFGHSEGKTRLSTRGSSR